MLDYTGCEAVFEIASVRDPMTKKKMGWARAENFQQQTMGKDSEVSWV